MKDLAVAGLNETSDVRKIGLDRAQSILAALLFFMMVMNYLDRQALSVVAPMMRKELGLSVTQYANAVNAFLVGYAIMYTGSGLVIDRIGYRSGLALFVALWSLFSGLHAAVTGFGTLLFFRFLLGVAEPGGFTGAVKTISLKFSATQRGFATSFLNMGTGLGSLIAPPFMVFFSLRYGWRTAFFVASVAGAIWLPCWLWATQLPSAEVKNVQPISDSSLRDKLSLLGNRRVLAYMLMRFFADSSGYFVLFWIPEYLMSSKQFTFLMVGSLGWIPLCAKDLGAFLGGYVSSRMVQSGLPPVFSRKIMLSAAAILGVVGALMEFHTSTSMVLLSLSLCTLAVGMWACNMHALAGDAFSPVIVASAHGLSGSAGAIGGIIFNSLIGYSSATQQHGVALLLFATLMPLGVAPLWLWLRDLASGERAAPGPITSLLRSREHEL